MKKSRLFSLLCAFCPGAGEMYMGLLKRGASIMLLFWGIVALCTLIPGFGNVSGRRIIFDGQDITRVAEPSLRENICIVPQDV